MNKLWATTALLALLAGCSGGDGDEPFFDDEDIIGGEGGDAEGGDNPDEGEVSTDTLDTGTIRPGGGAEPTSGTVVVRAEAQNDAGGGYLSSVRFVPATGTRSERFIVDGLGFDGANTYSRGEPVGSLNGFAVYESDIIVDDEVTGDPIGQIVPYRALYGVSPNDGPGGEPRTSFAIVRTGGYVNFGFGGFIYERNGGVTIPEVGQAVFSGDYAGIRVFEGRGGIEYTTGDAEIAIDFRDFDTNRGVRGTIENRAAFDINGEQIDLGGQDGLVLPELRILIEGDAETLRPNGEFAGLVSSFTVDDEGNFQEYETGEYYAVLAGDATGGDGGEVVGVVVVTSQDPRFGITAQETGGFILTRGSGN